MLEPGLDKLLQSDMKLPDTDGVTLRQAATLGLQGGLALVQQEIQRNLGAGLRVESVPAWELPGEGEVQQEVAAGLDIGLQQFRAARRMAGVLWRSLQSPACHNSHFSVSTV